MSTRIQSRRLPTGQFLFGAIVVLLGILLLLDTTGVVPRRSARLSAPSLFVLVGVWSPVQGRFQDLVGPLLVGTAGAWQLVALDYATVERVVVFWPVLVIAFGLSVLLGQFRSAVRETDDAFTGALAAFGGVSVTD